MRTLIAQSVPAKSSPALPATAPTSTVVAVPASQAPLTPAERPARHADVTYSQGLLAVKADNSSLNQILREIGRTTGIRITGGVADERVFGQYGPASPSTVLETLLDGTGSNMLLLQTETSAPGELVLTPRHGGPTPPNPNAPGFDDDNSSGDDTPRPAVQPPVQQQQVQPQYAPAGMSAPGQAAVPATSVPQTAPSSASDPADPNAVKSPQQIFEQLQRLRQQQQPPSQ